MLHKWRTRWLIPRFDGAILSKEWKEELWDKFVMGAPRTSYPAVVCTAQAMRGRARHQSGNTAIASFARATEPGTGHQRQDCRKVAEASDGRGYEDRTNATAVDGFNRSRGSDNRRVPTPHAPSAGRRCTCLYALQPSIPHLTRSALHRCLQRHGISRLPEIEGDKPKRQKFKRYPIGFFHIDIAEVQTAEERSISLSASTARVSSP